MTDPFERAVKLGRDAAHRRDPPESCPYRDLRKPDGRVTFSRAWRERWFFGYNEVRRELEAKGLWTVAGVIHSEACSPI